MKSLERERKLFDLLDQALELDPAGLQEMLAARCGEDASMCQEVRALYDSYHKNPAAFKSNTTLLRNALLAADRPARPALEPGQQFGRYKILERIGAGGMGEIYKAWEPELNRPVALKLLHLGSTGSEDLQTLLKEEGRAAAKFQSPNIVAVFDIDQEGEIPFLVMEYLDGETLRRSIGKLDLSQALKVAIGVATALVAARKEKYIHRDIKPENIMRCRDGAVKVLDFGLAKLKEHQAQPNAFSATAAAEKRGLPPVGTLKYMSPEQVVGKSLDERSDIFSLGVVLYEMVTGHRPFDRVDNDETRKAIVEDEPAPLSDYLPEVSGNLQHIVSKALRKERGKRYQTAQDLLNDLKDYRKSIKRLSIAKKPENRPIKAPPQAPKPAKPVGDPAKLKKYLPPVALPGAMQTPQVFNPLPFDLGTICGLDRSRFIAVIAGAENDHFFDNLVHVEQCLRRALGKQAATTFSLPERLWIQIDLATSTMAPADLAELSLAADYPGQLTAADFSPAIPGVFIQCHLAEAEEKDALIISAQTWCKALTRRIFSSQQLAIVLHIAANSAGDSEGLVRKVSEHLRPLQDDSPLSVFHALNRSEQPQSFATTGAASGFPDGNLSAPPGSYFRTWMMRIFDDRAAKQRLRGEAKSYAEVSRLYNSLLARDATKPEDKPIGFSDAADVIDDLARLPAISQEFHRQFLSLVDTYLPDQIEELLRAYISNSRGPERREALVFAVQKGYQDKLWASEPDLNCLFSPAGQEAPADATKSVHLLDAHAEVAGSITDRLVHLLLLQVAKGDGKVARSHLECLLDAERLSTSAKAVCELFLDRMDLQSFIRAYGKKAYGIALRAGYPKFDFSLAELETLDIDNPDLWALVTAWPMSEDRVAELLKMNPACRAILGLLRPKEWHEMARDRHLLQKVLSARQQRPLNFGN